LITIYSHDSDGGQRPAGQLMSVAKGIVIYHQGDEANHWYEVVSGTVRTCRFLGDGHRQLTGFFYTGDVFGVDRAIHREAAEAVTGVVLRRFSAVAPEQLEAASGAQHNMLERALESARECIFLFGHRTAANRVAAFLIAIADRSAAKSGVQIPMTRSDIADYLNLTLHTVSRTISEFARDQLIALDGPQNVRILDFERLRLLAGDTVEPGQLPPALRESA
jgi:CRP-like cAMP-binding protein